MSLNKHVCIYVCMYNNITVHLDISERGGNLLYVVASEPGKYPPLFTSTLVNN